jgi:hypothetical protein
MKTRFFLSLILVLAWSISVNATPVSFDNPEDTPTEILQKAQPTAVVVANTVDVNAFVLDYSYNDYSYTNVASNQNVAVVNFVNADVNHLDTYPLIDFRKHKIDLTPNFYNYNPTPILKYNRLLNNEDKQCNFKSWYNKSTSFLRLKTPFPF